MGWGFYWFELINPWAWCNLFDLKYTWIGACGSCSRRLQQNISFCSVQFAECMLDFSPGICVISSHVFGLFGCLVWWWLLLKSKWHCSFKVLAVFGMEKLHWKISEICPSCRMLYSKKSGLSFCMKLAWNITEIAL